MVKDAMIGQALPKAGAPALFGPPVEPLSDLHSMPRFFGHSSPLRGIAGSLAVPFQGRLKLERRP